MSSLDFTLNDFVTPVAICKAEADLGNILDIFAQTKADMLAMPLKNNTWGIISSQNILAFLAGSWQKNPVAIAGYPKKFSDAERESFSFKATAFNSSIEPAIVYLGSTKLTDFFADRDDNFFSTRRDTYLIADPSGNIQGKLDLKKLLWYLGSKFNNSNTNSYLPRWQNVLLDSLDSIPLPFKLETTRGKEVYRSKSWQLVDRKPNKHREQSSSDRSIANWWIKQQLDCPPADTFSASHSHTYNLGDEARQQHCCLDNRYYLQDRLDLFSQARTQNCSNSTKLQQQAGAVEHYPEFSVASNIDAKLSAHPDNIYFQQGAEWNYLRIPISPDIQQVTEEKNNRTIYWLTLAISASSIKNREFASLASVNDSMTEERLLAIIAHELKSPLTGIVGLSNLLKDRTIGTLNQRQRHYIELIYDGGHKLMNIVSDLLELTNLTAGKVHFKPEPIDLQSWCGQLYERVLTKLKSTDTSEFKLVSLSPKLQLNISPGLTTLIGDRSYFSALVSHLIWETIKFSTSIDILSINLEIYRSEDRIIMLLSNNAENPLSQKDGAKIKSSPNQPNINIVIAKYLAKIIGSEVQSLYYGEYCQFTLLIPQPNSFEPTVPPQAIQTSENTGLAFTPPKLDRGDLANKNNSPCNFTVLCLYLESEVTNPELVAREDLNTNLKHWVEQDWSDYDGQKLNYRHRIIEADGLEQAHTLARIWQLDVIVLDGHQIVDCDRYLRSLQQSEYLSALPLITLDTKTTEAANQIEGLNVYPCLLPAKRRSIKDLMQVIQIATGKESNK